MGTISTVTNIGDSVATISLDTSSAFDGLASGNSYNGNIKRMMLVYGGYTFAFAVNPEDYTRKMSHKGSITQTKGGAWIDTWGEGIGEISIRGTTGVRGSSYKKGLTSHPVDTGYKRWKNLQKLFKAVYENVKDGSPVTEYVKLYNFTDNDYFYCYPNQQGIELYRSKSRPHIYQYTMGLWVICEMPQSPTQIIDVLTSTTGAVIGNPFKSAEDSIPTSGTGGGDKSGETTSDEDATKDTAEERTEYEDGGTSDTTTNVTTKTTAEGSTSSYGSSIALNSEADTTTIVNTKTRTTAKIQADCYRYMTRMAPLIGGASTGKLVPATAYLSSKGINIGYHGTVSNVEGFNGKDWATDWDSDKYGEKEEYKVFVLSQIRFTPTVSPETYIIWRRIKRQSTSILLATYSTAFSKTLNERVQIACKGTDYDSTIFSLGKEYKEKHYLTETDWKRLKLVLLESFFVYNQLYKLYCYEYTPLQTAVTYSRLKILINNVRALAFQYSFAEDDNSKFMLRNLSSELRKLETILTEIQTYVIDYL